MERLDEMPNSVTPRYAVYAVPDISSKLWAFGSRILGYDASQNAIPSIVSSLKKSDDRWDRWTIGPRKYGFHATLKAPFYLRVATDIQKAEVALMDALADFALSTEPITIGPLEIQILKTFVALVPTHAPRELAKFAADCVEAFEAFRAPLSDKDIARRDPEKLSTRQREYLMKWGYPYVFDEFRYHMTLTGSLNADDLKVAGKVLHEEYGKIANPFILRHIALFKQPSPEEYFSISGVWRLGESGRIASDGN
jgi:hypothetical protein